MHKQGIDEGGLLHAERRKRILELLAEEGKVIAGELSTRFAVSEDTIRRDLRDLAGAGLLDRVHGGALPRSPISTEYAVRVRESGAAKTAIARLAVDLLRDGQVLALDSGTTSLRVAEILPPDLRITVVTHSPPVAVQLASHPATEVILIGGRLFKSSLATIGAATVDGYRRLRPDICLLGVASLDPQAGIGVFDFDEAEVKRAMLDGAAHVVALAGSEKLGTSAPFHVAPASALTCLITDADVPADDLQPYRDLGIGVLQPER